MASATYQELREALADVRVRWVADRFRLSPAAEAAVFPALEPLLVDGAVTLAVPAQSGQPYYQWQTDGGSSGGVDLALLTAIGVHGLSSAAGGAEAATAAAALVASRLAWLELSAKAAGTRSAAAPCRGLVWHPGAGAEHAATAEKIAPARADLVRDGLLKYRSTNTPTKHQEESHEHR